MEGDCVDGPGDDEQDCDRPGVDHGVAGEVLLSGRDPGVLLNFLPVPGTDSRVEPAGVSFTWGRSGIYGQIPCRY